MKETVPVTVWVASVGLTVKVSACTDYACMDIYNSNTSNQWCILYVYACRCSSSKAVLLTSSHNYC